MGGHAPWAIRSGDGAVLALRYVLTALHVAALLSVSARTPSSAAIGGIKPSTSFARSRFQCTCST